MPVCTLMLIENGHYINGQSDIGYFPNPWEVKMTITKGDYYSNGHTLQWLGNDTLQHYNGWCPSHNARRQAYGTGHNTVLPVLLCAHAAPKN